MNRSRINWLGYLAFVVLAGWLSVRLPAEAGWVFSGILALLLVAVGLVGFQYFRGQRLMREQRWVEAAAAFTAFQTSLEGSAFRRGFTRVFSSRYTRDGIALAQNGLAAIALENHRPEVARTHVENALKRDPDYAVAHYNLALVLAAEGKESDARAEADRSIQLGLKRREVEPKLNDAIAKAKAGLT